MLSVLWLSSMGWQKWLLWSPGGKYFLTEYSKQPGSGNAHIQAIPDSWHQPLILINVLGSNHEQPFLFWLSYIHTLSYGRRLGWLLKFQAIWAFTSHSKLMQLASVLCIILWSGVPLAHSALECRNQVSTPTTLRIRHLAIKPQGWPLFTLLVFSRRTPLARKILQESSSS